MVKKQSKKYRREYYLKNKNKQNEQSRIWRILNKDKMAMYSLNWYHKQNKEYKNKCKNSKNEWRKSNRELYNKQSREWQQKHPLQCKAKGKVRDAIKYGKLIKKGCEVCGNKKTEAHHQDYNKPLEVVWLCKKCHCELHKFLNINKRKAR